MNDWQKLAYIVWNYLYKCWLWLCNQYGNLTKSPQYTEYVEILSDHCSNINSSISDQYCRLKENINQRWEECDGPNSSIYEDQCTPVTPCTPCPPVTPDPCTPCPPVTPDPCTPCPPVTPDPCTPCPPVISDSCPPSPCPSSGVCNRDPCNPGWWFCLKAWWFNFLSIIESFFNRLVNKNGYLVNYYMCGSHLIKHSIEDEEEFKFDLKRQNFMNLGSVDIPVNACSDVKLEVELLVTYYLLPPDCTVELRCKQLLKFLIFFDQPVGNASYDYDGYGSRNAFQLVPELIDFIDINPHTVNGSVVPNVLQDVALIAQFIQVGAIPGNGIIRLTVTGRLDRPAPNVPGQLILSEIVSGEATVVATYNNIPIQ